MDEWDEEMDEWDEEMDKWDEEMDEWDEEMDKWDEQTVNEALDIAAIDMAARENGEKPAEEWTRNDFRNLSRHHPQLKNLTISELRALFLVPTSTIDGVLYCLRGDVREVRKRRRDGGKPFYALAISPAASYAAVHAYPGACQRLEDEKKKIEAIWREL